MDKNKPSELWTSPTCSTPIGVKQTSSGFPPDFSSKPKGGLSGLSQRLLRPPSGKRPEQGAHNDLVFKAGPGSGYPVIGLFGFALLGGAQIRVTHFMVGVEGNPRNTNPFGQLIDTSISAAFLKCINPALLVLHFPLPKDVP